MKKLNLLSLTVGVTLCVVSLGAQAASWRCEHGNNVREIHIQTESPASAAPCSVVYKKVTEGAEDQVLWTATNDASFCEEKAKAFVAKQVAWGWTCAETASDKNTANE